MADIHQQLAGNHNRRMANMDRAIDALEIRAERLTAAEDMIGTLIRAGKTVFYVWPQGGKYREGTRYDLSCFLVRNNYA